MNYHLSGKQSPIAGNVCDYVQVRAGDIMFRCDDVHQDLRVNLRSKSGGTDYYYPFYAGTTHSGRISSVTNGLAYRFAGIALFNSLKGSTDTISIATEGIWKMELTAQGGVTAGRVVFAKTSGWSVGSHTTPSYTVKQGGGGCSVGWVMKTEAAVKEVSIKLQTLLGDGIAQYL